MRKALRSLFAQFGAAVRPCDGASVERPRILPESRLQAPKG